MKIGTWWILGACGFAVLGVGCATSLEISTAPTSADPLTAEVPPADDTLYGTAWVQTAGEYAALCRQAYTAAQRSLDAALADARWTAATEQAGRSVADLPPAIIVDVDETVLDNSPYQARLILDGVRYDEDSWSDWVKRAEAEPVPGAVTFLNAAAARGVTVFYVTNRMADDEAATERNLRAAGFPLTEGRDVLLLKGENGWGSDKQARRELIAREFRIILLCGDDLNDFVNGARIGEPEPRRALVERYAQWFGQKWIVLPNPVYGSWEASLFGRDYGLDPLERRARIRGALRSY